MCGYGIAFWLPSLMMRSFGLDLIGVGQFFGALLLTGGVAGVLFGGWIGDRLGGRDRRYYALVPALSYIAGTPLFVAGVLSSHWAWRSRCSSCRRRWSMSGWGRC